jgi:hypothetical protein
MKEHDIDQMLNITGFHCPMTKTLCLALFLDLCLTGQDFPRPLYNISILHIHMLYIFSTCPSPNTCLSTELVS